MKEKESGFRADEESLKIAKEMAKKLSLSYNEEEVRELANNLQRFYYEEILEKINIPLENTAFSHGSIRQLIARVKQNQNMSNDIYFDEQLDFWISSMCFLNSIATFTLPTLENDKEQKEAFYAILTTYRMPYSFEFERELILPLLKKHKELLLFSHDLSKAMIVFVLCHEIAHILQEHFDDKLDNHTTEFEADHHGFLLFKKVITHSDKTGYIAMQDMFLGAPIVFFYYISLAERYVESMSGVSPSRETHPAPLERAAKLKTLLNEIEIEKANEILKNLLDGVYDLEEFLMP